MRYRPRRKSLQNMYPTKDTCKEISNTQLQKKQKTTEISPKRTYRWKLSTQKDAQYDLSIKERQTSHSAILIHISQSP